MKEQGRIKLWTFWKQDSLFLDAENLLQANKYAEALVAFKKAWEENPEHYYLANYIQHLELLQSPEYEDLKMTFNTYIGQYGNFELYKQNDQFYYETNEGFIYKLLPLTESQFMIPSQLNSHIQIVKEAEKVKGLKFVYRDGKEEFHPRR